LKIKPQYPFPKEDTIAFASDNINLAIEINDFCKENNKKIFFPEPGSPDLVAASPDFRTFSLLKDKIPIE